MTCCRQSMTLLPYKVPLRSHLRRLQGAAVTTLVWRVLQIDKKYSISIPFVESSRSVPEAMRCSRPTAEDACGHRCCRDCSQQLMWICVVAISVRLYSSAGETREPAKTNLGGRNHDNSSAEHLRITSENQWRVFANSLASEGLVVELIEQQQLQNLWDRAAAGATSFGRTYVPTLGNLTLHKKYIRFLFTC